MGQTFTKDYDEPVQNPTHSNQNSKPKRLTQEEWQPLYEKECLKSTHPDYCYHFYSDKIHDIYITSLCKHDSETGKPYKIDYPEDVKVRYNFSEKKLQRTRPTPPHTPIFPYRSHIETKFLSNLEKTIEEIKEGCSADCWGVYVRDVKTHKIIEMLYNFRIHSKIKKGIIPRNDVGISNLLPEDWLEPRHPYFPCDTEDEKERERLIDDQDYVSKILESLGEDKELVIVYNYQFREEIYRQIPKSEKFLQITFTHNKEGY